MAPRPEFYETILTRALTEELGLVIETNNPIYLSEMLYRWRKESGSADMADLGIIKPGSGDRIFIVRKSAELEA